MDKFDHKLKAARPDHELRGSLTHKVMSRINRQPRWNWLDSLLTAGLLASVGLFVAYAAADHLGPVLSLLFTDFDIVSQYPVDFLAAVGESVPWIFVVTTTALATVLLWHARRRTTDA